MAPRSQNSSTPAQGSGSTDQPENLLSGLERSELTEARNEALKDAQSTDPNAPNYIAPKIEDEQPGTLLEAQTPEWVQTILDSNQDLIDSNNLVLSALDAFKENSADFVSQLVKEFAKPSVGGEKVSEPKLQLVNEGEHYEVAPGKSFRDPQDFAKEYTEGVDVTHLGVIKLQALLNSGLIVES